MRVVYRGMGTVLVEFLDSELKNLLRLSDRGASSGIGNSMDKDEEIIARIEKAAECYRFRNETMYNISEVHKKLGDLLGLTQKGQK